jgi:hypothetical protein
MIAPQTMFEDRYNQAGIGLSAQRADEACR